MKKCKEQASLLDVGGQEKGENITQAIVNNSVEAPFENSLGWIIEMANIGLWDWHLPSGRVVYSEQWAKIAGYDKGELPQDISTWESAVFPEDLELANRAIHQYLAGERDTYEAEFRLVRKDKSVIWAQDKGAVAEWDEHGKPVRLVGVLQDITRQKDAEEKLQAALLENKQHNKRLEAEVQSTAQHLAQTEKLNKAMFEANPYPNLLFDDRFRVVDCNPAAVEQFGFSSKEDLLENLVEVIRAGIPAYQPDGRESISLHDRLQDVVRQGYVEFETEIDIGGALTPLQVIFKKIPYKDSFAIAAYQINLKQLKETESELLRQDKLLRDVNTASSKLMASKPEEFDRTMWEALKIMGQSVDVDRMYIWQNFVQDEELCCRQIYEWSEGAEPQQGKEFAEHTVYDSIPLWRDTLRQDKCINALVKDLPAEERAGLEPQGILSVLVIPVFHRGVFWGFVGFDNCHREHVFAQVDEQVLRSAGITFVSAILRDEITQNLIAAKEVAVESAQAKSDFLSRMSHEIRTPMNAIVGMASIAKRMDDVEQIQYCLDKIDTASEQLLGIINDILDMSKIEANKFEISHAEFDFERMLQNVSNMIGVRVEEKHQNFVFDFERMFIRNVISDELRLSQVILNLLTNAVKFTPENGEISLKVRVSAQDDDHAVLRVEVKDSGIGLSKEEQSRLFRSFEQADGGITRKYGGTGLGLAICKKITNLMGGDIWLESSVPGEGSRFVFEVGIEWGEARKDELVKKLPSQDMRVLVVDDNEDVLFSFQKILGGFSLACDVANSGKTAIERARQNLEAGTPYDLIFLDWMMPEMDGVETAKEIKRIMNDNIIVVMISAAEWPEIEHKVDHLGIARFLPKPILPSALFNAIVELTSQSLIPERERPACNTGCWQGRTILLADDVEINREIMSGILADTGVEIEYAENGRQAVEMYERGSGRYSLILMDVQMPEVDGLAATRAIRASDCANARRIPVLAMTANAFKEDVEACLAAGMNGHIAKPIDIDDLMDKISLYLDGEP